MEQEEKKKERKFIGVNFKCCNIYQRVYINSTGTGYWGACPKCARQVKFTIGSGGSESRFFDAQ